jgi:hypothetical protein
MTQKTGSDLSLGNPPTSIHVGFACDGESVTATFYDKEQQLGESKTFSRAEAIERGKLAEESGLYEYLPVTLSSDYVKEFGIRLRRYGEKGC